MIVVEGQQYNTPRVMALYGPQARSAKLALKKQALEWVLPTFFQGFWAVGTVTKLERVCFVRGNLKSQAITPPSDPAKLIKTPKQTHID